MRVGETRPLALNGVLDFPGAEDCTSGNTLLGKGGFSTSTEALHQAHALLSRVMPQSRRRGGGGAELTAVRGSVRMCEVGAPGNTRVDLVLPDTREGIHWCPMENSQWRVNAALGAVRAPGTRCWESGPPSCSPSPVSKWSV